MFDSKEIRSQFPIFNQKIDGKPIIYFDNAATSQKPQSVIDAIKTYYETTNANIHRGAFTLAEKATDGYEATRETVAKFINASQPEEIVFTKNCTEAINLVAFTWGKENIQEGDEIIVTELEHHANLLPWQELAKHKKAKLTFIPVKEDLTLDFEKFQNLINKKTKFMAITGMSNVTGTITDLKKFLQEAKKHGITTLVDASQSICHNHEDVQDLDCDFLAFTAHKLYGPTGVGILYGKMKVLDYLKPFLYGGSMIKTVDKCSALYAEVPQRFEAGTPNIAGVTAFKESIKFVQNLGSKNIANHERSLLKKAKEILAEYPEVKMYTPKDVNHANSILSFSIDGIHAHDISTIFNEFGICIRAGHHCAEPLVAKLDVPATARMSFSVYNTEAEIEIVDQAIKKCLEIFNSSNERSE